MFLCSVDSILTVSAFTPRYMFWFAEVRSPLRGLGVGLSLSRWHMQHFGGDLVLERRPSGVLRVRSDTGRRSKWHILGKGMTATITIPKNSSIPLVIS